MSKTEQKFFIAQNCLPKKGFGGTIVITMEAQLSWLEYLLDMQGVADSSSAVSTKTKSRGQKTSAFCFEEEYSNEESLKRVAFDGFAPKLTMG